MNIYENNGQKMAYQSLGTGDTAWIWVHGWGVDHRYLSDLAQSLGPLGKHYLVDLPGFGGSPRPATDWTLGDYVDFMAQFCKSLGPTPCIWVGHSFGGRIGIKLAATHPTLLSKLIVIGGSGLRQNVSLVTQIKRWISVRTFKFLKLFVRTEEQLNQLRSRFGSADYRNAGSMRKIFLNTFSEFLQDVAPNVSCPVALYYGDKDQETKPEIGMGFKRLIPNSQLEILADVDHYSYFTSGRHQLAQRMKQFVSN